MDAIDNEFSALRTRHLAATRAAEHSIDHMVRILSEVDAAAAALRRPASRLDHEGDTRPLARPSAPSPASAPPPSSPAQRPHDAAAAVPCAMDTDAPSGGGGGGGGSSGSGGDGGGDGSGDGEGMPGDAPSPLPRPAARSPAHDPMQVDNAAAPPAPAAIDAGLQKLLSCCKALQASLVSDHKSVGAAMNKYGKAIDNATVTNLSDICAPSVRLQGDAINDAVAAHLFREGMFDIGRSFLKEARVDLSDDHIRPFERLYHILTAFRANDLEPAIAWTQEQRHCLSSTDSNLEFRLHCLAYLQILQNESRQAALSYARIHLSQFPEHISVVQKLLTCIIFKSDIAASPYKHMVHPSHRDNIERCLSREYCRAQGLPKDSLLLTVVRCGTKAIPTLLKASRIAQNLHELGIDDALPVEIDVGRDCRFHSIFTCPVSKEEAMDDNNVPMILPCGHVLSKQSIARLPRGSARFKCPYCPNEQVGSDCRELHI